MISSYEPKVAKYLTASLEQLPFELLEQALLAYLQHAPLSLALREINRLMILREEFHALDLPQDTTILDVGCGDGFWWDLLDKRQQQVYGIDISAMEVRQARHRLLAVERFDISSPDIQRLVTQAGWPSAFDFAVGNCSLEHIFALETALANIASLTKRGGHFILFVPTQTWALQGLGMSYLRKHFPRLAMASAGAMNGFFQHWHLYDERVWQMLLESKGFAVDKVIYMGQRRSEFLFRLGLPSAFLAFLFKRMFGVYPNRFAPLFMRRLATRIVARVLSSAQGVGTDNEERDSAYEYAFLCQRIAR